MNNFNGIPCVHCGHQFEPTDDVVVCPICGAPHHRSCFRELGHCALEAQHAPDFEWTPPASAVAASDAPSCPTCGAPHVPSANFCPSCGRRLSEATAGQARQGSTKGAPSGGYSPFAGANPYRGNTTADTAPQWEVDGVSAREISAYVGNGTFYFLRQFQFLLQSRFNVSWNWPAFFFKYIYLFYRKLYFYGGLILAFFILSGIPMMLYSIELFKAEYVPQFFGMTVPYNAALMEQLGNIISPLSALRFVMSLLCGMFANKLLLNRTLSDVHALRLEFDTEPRGNDYFNMLNHIGRPNRTLVFILLGLGLIAYFYFCYYLAASVGLY